MGNRMETVNYDSVDVALDDQNNDDEGSDTSDSYTEFDSQRKTTECSTLIRNNNENQNDVINRRISNYMDPSARRLTEYDEIELYSVSHKTVRQTQNKSFKRFLFVFGFASTVIILSQLYLSLYYDEPSLQVSLSGWDRNRTRSIPFYILPNVNTTLIEPTTLCKENTPILLLIVICSAADNFEIRQTLRETWANTTEFNYSKFAVLHSHFGGKYLPINYPDWKNFTVRNDDKYSTESSENPNENISNKNFNEPSEPSHANFQIRTVFLLGQTDNNETQEQIINESRTHNDLIQESFLDSYNNLTLKSVMMLKWINSNCEGKVNFLMKCDDDTFVNVPNLVHFLLGGTIPVYDATLHHYNEQTVRTLSPKNRLMHYDNLLIGVRFCHSKPISDYRSKWFTPRYMYDKRVYPNYLSGTGYVFTMDTAEKLYNASMDSPLLHLEDVYLTGICAEKAEIQPKNYHLFNYLSYKELCEFRGMITIHEIISSDMKKAYDFITNSNVTCAPPTRITSVRPLRKTRNYCG